MTVPHVTFVWGLKRSGIHLVVGWLYANLGATAKEALVTTGLHPQLRDGFCDGRAGVAFFNNCGRWHSRRHELGDLSPHDFELAASQQRAAIFGIEDCALRQVDRTPGPDGVMRLLVLRDPLNTLASRLEAATSRPDVFPVDESFVELYADYCAELLGRTSLLDPKVCVSFNRFVSERSYRDELAATLDLPNLDLVSEVSDYGGGSSFSGSEPSSTDALLSRYREHPVPGPLVEMLLERPVVREACSTVFGYDLAALAGSI